MGLAYGGLPPQQPEEEKRCIYMNGAVQCPHKSMSTNTMFIKQFCREHMPKCEYEILGVHCNEMVPELGTNYCDGHKCQYDRCTDKIFGSVKTAQYNMPV